MTTLVCDFSDVLGTPVPGGIARITSGEVRPGFSTPSVIVPRIHEQPLVGGSATFHQVDPGNVVIHLIWGDHNATIRTLVPDQETVTLSDCLQIQYTIPSDIETARREALAARQAAADAAASAEEAAAAVETAASGAIQEVHDAVAADRALIEGYKDAAAASAVEASGIVADAAGVAIAAVQEELSEELARSEAAAAKAEQHEAGAAAAAAQEVNKLKGDAPEAFDTLEEIAAELAANETERSALTNSIAAKADRVHTHPQSEVDGLEVALDGKADTGHKHVSADITDAVPGSSVAPSYGNRLVRLGASGRLSVPLTPTASDQPTSKQYVDAQVATRATTAQVEARTPEIRVVATPEQATSPGVLYVVEED